MAKLKLDNQRDYELEDFLRQADTLWLIVATSRFSTGLKVYTLNSITFIPSRSMGRKLESTSNDLNT